jgi:hypothetical protein
LTCFRIRPISTSKDIFLRAEIGSLLGLFIHTLISGKPAMRRDPLKADTALEAPQKSLHRGQDRVG